MIVGDEQFYRDCVSGEVNRMRAAAINVDLNQANASEMTGRRAARGR